MTFFRFNVSTFIYIVICIVQLIYSQRWSSHTDLVLRELRSEKLDLNTFMLTNKVSRLSHICETLLSKHRVCLSANFKHS